jgi:hypothetical protein
MKKDKFRIQKSAFNRTAAAAVRAIASGGGSSGG